MRLGFVLIAFFCHILTVNLAVALADDAGTLQVTASEAHEMDIENHRKIGKITTDQPNDSQEIEDALVKMFDATLEQSDLSKANFIALVNDFGIDVNAPFYVYNREHGTSTPASYLACKIMLSVAADINSFENVGDEPITDPKRHLNDVLETLKLMKIDFATNCEGKDLVHFFKSKVSTENDQSIEATTIFGAQLDDAVKSFKKTPTAQVPKNQIPPNCVVSLMGALQIGGLTVNGLTAVCQNSSKTCSDESAMAYRHDCLSRLQTAIFAAKATTQWTCFDWNSFCTYSTYLTIR